MGVFHSSGEVDGSTFRALKITPRPIDCGTLGFYRLATTVSLVASQTANGTLFSFRWGDATRLCVVQFVRLEVLQTSAAVATIMPRYQVFIARSFTASDSVGTAITLTDNSMKKRTSMGTTLVTDIRKSAASAGLTVGTRTLDSEPILEIASNLTTTTPNETLYSREIDLTNSGDHPIVFVQNEGLIVRGPTVVFDATVTASLLVEMAWAEVASY